MKPLRILSLIGFLATFIVGCATLPAMDKPEVKGISPHITGIDFQGLDMAFDVDVNNPYPIPIRTPMFKYGLDIEGSRFFNSEATSKLDLPAKRIGTATLPVRLSYKDLFNTYSALKDAPEAAYNLNGALVLPIRGRKIEVPLSHSGTVPIIRPPKFSDIKFQVSEASLMRAKIGVDAAMKNPNAFALGIERLGYALKLGNVELGDLTATTLETLEPGQTGRLSLSGEVSAASALLKMIKGGNIGGASIIPSGSVQTPYGPIRFNPGS